MGWCSFIPSSSERHAVVADPLGWEMFLAMIKLLLPVWWFLPSVGGVVGLLQSSTCLDGR